MSERNFIDDSIVFDEESLPKGMKEEIKDLEKLLYAYRKGLIKEKEGFEI